MDPATIFGILLAFGSLIAMIFLEGASIQALLIPAPMVLVFGATIAVGIASGTVPDAILAAKALPRAFKGMRHRPQETIDRLVELAEVARRQGLLALEREAENERDPFLKSALRSLADGMDPDELAIMLEDQIASQERSQRIAARFYTAMGGYAPTIGIIGTVVSLTYVLGKLDEPSALGEKIAAAFVATLWGVLTANFMWIPIGTRLNRLAELDVARMQMITEGVLAMQSGSQPRAIDERLRALVPQHELAKAG